MALCAIFTRASSSNPPRLLRIKEVFSRPYRATNEVAIRGKSAGLRSEGALGVLLIEEVARG